MELPSPPHSPSFFSRWPRRAFGQFLRVDVFSAAAAVSLLAGAVAVQMLTALPSPWIDLAIGCSGLASLSVRRLRWLGFALLAAAWTIWRADLAMSARLPANLEGEDVVVVGSVRGLPRAQDESTRFDFVVRDAEYAGRSIALHGILRLSWYNDAPMIKPCAHWRLHVRLKRPRGMIDPGGFDFERYALSEGIVATGYVRDDTGNAASGADALCVDRLRAYLTDAIADELGTPSTEGLLRALAFGDQHAMDEHEWAVARATGIPHLIAISGLHIALFAGFGVWLVRLLWKIFPRLTLRMPAPLIEAIASIVFALGYATLAGLGLPTRRALVMIGVLLAANLSRRARTPVQGLAFAVIVLLAFDPLCVLSAGFWLSFVGVAWLMFCLGGRDGTPRRHWRELVGAQFVASVGLLPLTIWFFGQSSLIGPLANLIAVPCICLLVLPLTVLGALLMLCIPAIGAPLLHVADFVMHLLWSLLERMAGWPGALWYFPEPSAWSLGLAMLGALWLLLPRGIPARALGALLFLPLLLPERTALRDGEFDVFVLDVGRGLAVIVRTREHSLIYDAGARFPSGFDLGDAAVTPALHALGLSTLDRMIISHGDNDHAGGAAAVLAAFPTTPVQSGEPARLKIPATQCLAGEAWDWNGVHLRIVHPHEPLSTQDNDRCCVLDIRSGDGELLLSGDITSMVEEEIAAAISPPLADLVLQVPHHGSKTSSSESFLAALQPVLALVSAGYRNHFHHPNPLVVARYANAQIPMLNTAQSGFMQVHFAPDMPPRVVELGRRDRHPYWRE